jgi:hypothetical protein
MYMAKQLPMKKIRGNDINWARPYPDFMLMPKYNLELDFFFSIRGSVKQYN